MGVSSVTPKDKKKYSKTNDKPKSIIKKTKSKHILLKFKNKDIANYKPAKINNVKSNYILSKIYINLVKKKSLQIFQYNKKLQNRLNLDIKNYKEYYEAFMLIEIEIIPCSNKYGKFININENDKIYYHIYFNDNKEETKNIYLIKKENNVKKN